MDSGNRFVILEGASDRPSRRGAEASLPVASVTAGRPSR
jgi:hypothetical protein